MATNIEPHGPEVIPRVPELVTGPAGAAPDAAPTSKGELQ